MAHSWVQAAAVAAALLTSAAQAETWWYLGSTTDGKGLYIDADSLDYDYDDYAYYRGMFVYPATEPMDNGEQVRYEIFTADVDCLMGDLYEYDRSFYRDDRSLITTQKTGETYPVESGKASEWEADFACEAESYWTSRGFRVVSDPVANTRGW